MEKELHYEFVNSQIGNVIAHLSLPADMDEKKRKEQLEKKRAEQVIEDKLFIELIYWQDKNHCIQ